MPKEALNLLEEIWEIFKSLLPLTVALITIWVNGINQRKKQEYDKKNQYVNEIQEKIMELNNLMWSAGADVLEAIQRAGDKEKHEYYMEKYMEDIQLMLMKAREINGICDITFIILQDKKFVFDDVFNMIGMLNKKYMGVIQCYNKQAKDTPLCKVEKLYDQAQKQLINISQSAEDSFINFCIKIKS